MAAMWRFARQTLKLNVSFCRYHELRRTLLSEAYLCKDVWDDRLHMAAIKNLNFGDFAVQMHGKFIQDKRSSVIDMEILANKISDITKTEAQDESLFELIEDIMHKYRQSPDAFPVRDSIVHGIIRNYLDIGKENRLMKLFLNRMNYGLFPDHYTANILMNHFIKKNQYKEAAKVGYYLMLQEDFSNLVSFHLSMLSCVKHLKSIVAELDAYNKEEPEPEDEEETWVAVKVIPQPYYDDHFDISNEQFLMGKTLSMMGKKQGDNLLGRSLQIAGLGLYNKFSKALSLLVTWRYAKQEPIIFKESLSILQECLDKALTRDPEEPEKEINIRTTEDEMKKLRLTPKEKEDCLEVLKTLTDTLESTDNKLSTQSLEKVVEDLVKAETPKYEANDINQQCKLFKQWEKERVQLFDQQVREYKRRQVLADIEDKLLEMQEREEVLTYFEKKDTVGMIGSRVRVVKKKEVRELTEDELEEKLKARMSAIKKKKR